MLDARPSFMTSSHYMCASPHHRSIKTKPSKFYLLPLIPYYFIPALTNLLTM